MPNWVYNKLIISQAEEAETKFDPDEIERALHPDPPTVPKDDAEAIIVALQPEYEGEVLSFENLLPTPEDLLENDGWYEWRVDNWGTKWDASDTILFKGEDAQETMGSIRLPENALVYLFKTAWGPPVEWVEKLSDVYPGAIFHLVYVEEMGNFSGLFLAWAGLSHSMDLTVDTEGVLHDYGMNLF